MLRLRCLGLIALLSALTAPARADPSAAETAGAAPPTSAHGRPSFLTAARKIGAREAATKTEGTYVNGLPIIDVDPDTGVGFGAVGNVFWDGPRSDPFFRYSPYRQRIGAQAFATTAGLQQHFIDYDAPYIGDTPFRLRANILYERNIAANYFGRGARTLDRLGFTGAGRTYANLSDYNDALRALTPDGFARTHYNKFDLEDPALRASLERIFLGGLIRVQVGLGFSYVRIRDYSGQRTDADDPVTGRKDIRANEAPTRLHEDCQAAHVVGCSGGLHNTLKLGLALDTRDYEPDPNSGVYIDLTGEFSSRVLGSSFDYARLTFGARGYVSPFAQWIDLVFAGRVVYSLQSSGTPFFAMNTLSFTDVDRQGLGGLWTLRGYRQDRFVGAITGLVNLEARWTFTTFDVLDQHIGLALVPFLDLGRVFDRVTDFALTRWKPGTGGSLHIAWNDATIIDITCGISSEGTQVYMDLGQQF